LTLNLDLRRILMSFEARLKELGITLPEAPRPVAAYVPCVVVDGLVFTAGQLPTAGGVVRFAGRVGAELTMEEGREAARLCALNCLAVIRAAAGSLDNVVQLVKLTGFVASAPDFHGQPQVLNGASEFLEAVFGPAGRHARTAGGVAALPLGAAVELEMVVKVGLSGLTV
jgi:enamine deaminase RidA (YjgF/YER057c/UK114 family)